jgi:RimJ/RimL family protein N-acetyltransferase
VKPSSLELRPFERADFPRLISWVPDARFLLQWAGPGYTFPLDEAQLEANQCQSESDPPARYIFKAVLARSGDAIGHIELSPRPSCRGRLGRVLVGEAWRGRGHGLRVVRLACEFGFATLGLREVELGVYEFNTAAIACYESLGFVSHGVESHQPFEGESWPGLRMSLAAGDMI